MNELNSLTTVANNCFAITPSGGAEHVANFGNIQTPGQEIGNTADPANIPGAAFE